MFKQTPIQGKDMHETIVIGGGIIGASIGYHLARAGRDTLLVDRDGEGKATEAGAGIISPPTNQVTSLTWNEFAIEAEKYYPVIANELAPEHDGEVGYTRCGKLTVAVSEGERALFRQAKDRIDEQRNRLGYPEADKIYEVSQQEAEELFPALGPVHEALFYEDAARVDGAKFSRALVRAGENSGLRVESGNAERLWFDGEAVIGVIADGEPIRAHDVVIAGGAWSNEFEAQLGMDIPVEPQRGQIVHLDLHDVTTADWAVVNAFRDHYIVPWKGNRVAAGATHEHGVGFVPHSTVEGIKNILDETLRIAPDLNTAAIREIKVGLRPWTRDGRPIIGPAPQYDNVYIATGHGGYGLQLGPYTGKVIADLCLDRDTDPNVSHFAPG